MLTYRLIVRRNSTPSRLETSSSYRSKTTLRHILIPIIGYLHSAEETTQLGYHEVWYSSDMQQHPLHGLMQARHR